MVEKDKTLCMWYRRNEGLTLDLEGQDEVSQWMWMYSVEINDLTMSTKGVRSEYWKGKE